MTGQSPFDPRKLSLDVMQAAEVMTAFFDAAEHIAQSWLMAMLGVARGGGQ
ncbi:hypothetical protein ACFRNT_11440 [Streptomyces sp. NPDC056697]|uniref:hypothetical protein n=1 Tax=Streptomyces sp. NPDC056697 TaxID=3345915 RepID=UPI0036817696